MAWRSESLAPASMDNVASLVKLARRARDRIVEFDWYLDREELERLRGSVHCWEGPLQGK